jgi:hypothetical protein
MTPDCRKRRLVWGFVSAVSLSLIAVDCLQALYAIGQIQTVPIERLIQNMEQLIANDPKDATLRFNLARVHAMAFALKMTDTQTTQTAGGRDAWFGPEHDHVPFKVVATTDPALIAIAKDHLARAITIYRQGIELDPNNVIAKLGYAWCLDQSGDKGAAITAYRHVVAEGWRLEQGLVRHMMEGTTPVGASSGNMLRAGLAAPQTSLSPGFRSITVEASTYLMPYLDPEKDKDELATLRERMSYFNSLGRAITPIAIPLLDGIDVSDIVDRTAQVKFDADGSGILKRWSWISPAAGWLVHAPEGTRGITSALQMFGSVTFWLFWDNGYQALRALDDNADGELNGAELDGLAVWQDTNVNGVSEPDEVRPLASWGIVSLSWEHETNERSRDYVAHSHAGVTLEDGRTRPTWDILLYSQPAAAGETE